MKGIILAGGLGSRLFPITKVISKQLLPIYNKPMIYYPLSNLIRIGIREILIISTPNDLILFKKLLKDGQSLGCRFSYAEQKDPKGLSEAFIIGKEFINGDSVCLILGDNIFHNITFFKEQKNTPLNGGIVYAYKVKNPSRYGVIEFDKNNIVKRIEEKPKNPKSSYAVPGIYFYDKDVVEKVSLIKPSKRGELEITDLNNLYIKEKKLKVIKMEKDSIWLDAGTFQSLLEAAQFIEAIENRQATLIGSIELAAYKAGFINKEQLLKVANGYNQNSGYGNLLIKNILEE